MTRAADAERGFAPLPRPRDDTGATRRVGVEIEFAGLLEADVARLAQRDLGGRIAREGRHEIVLEDTALGRLTIELDTALKAWGGNPLVDAGLDAARALIPVEIVTAPLDWPGLARLDAFRETLRQAGAVGTQDGVLVGFGVHFNVATVGFADPFTARTIIAYGLLEDWLRTSMPIDATRRMMPFVDPWPADFVATLAADPAPDIAEIRAGYARRCNSRNFGLDLLPLFADADAAAFARLFADQTNTKGRPAFHYRLPDSRIDEADWSLAAEWRRWHVVETVADAPGLLEELCAAYRRRTRPYLGQREGWAAEAEVLLAGAGLSRSRSSTIRQTE